MKASYHDISNLQIKQLTNATVWLISTVWMLAFSRSAMSHLKTLPQPWPRFLCWGQLLTRGKTPPERLTSWSQLSFQLHLLVCHNQSPACLWLVSEPLFLIREVAFPEIAILQSSPSSNRFSHWGRKSKTPAMLMIRRTNFINASLADFPEGGGRLMKKERT